MEAKTIGVKFIKDGEIISDNQYPQSLTDEQEQEILKFKDYEVVSYLIEFAPNIKLQDVNSIADLTPDQFKGITITIR